MSPPQLQPLSLSSCTIMLQTEVRPSLSQVALALDILCIWKANVPSSFGPQSLSAWPSRTFCLRNGVCGPPMGPFWIMGARHYFLKTVREASIPAVHLLGQDRGLCSASKESTNLNQRHPWRDLPGKTRPRATAMPMETMLIMYFPSFQHRGKLQERA